MKDHYDESQLPQIKGPDERPKKGRWAPGDYWCICTSCNESFWGDKRANVCADCAYEEED